MTTKPTDPTDAEIEALLAAIPAEEWSGLWDAVDRLVEVSGAEGGLVHWAGGGQVGTTMVRGVETPVYQVHYAVHSNALNHVVRRLYELRLVTSLNWPEWDGIERYRQGRGVDRAPVADAVRLITAVIRSDRFSEGAIVAAVEDGTLPAALRRLRDWYRSRPTPRPSGDP
jgi:hypothetical protein